MKEQGLSAVGWKCDGIFVQGCLWNTFQSLTFCVPEFKFQIWGLAQSGWMASKGFSTKQSVTNLLTAYYAVLLGMMHSQELMENHWESIFLSLATCRNFCALCGHGVLRSLSNGGEASCMSEAPIETWTNLYLESVRNVLSTWKVKTCRSTVPRVIFTLRVEDLFWLGLWMSLDENLNENPGAYIQGRVLQQGVRDMHSLEAYSSIPYFHKILGRNFRE